MKHGALSKAPLCAGTVRQEEISPADHLLVEACAPSKPYIVALADLPREVFLQGKQFTLRGVVHFREPPMNGTTGHFVAYCRRISGQWIEYDDLANLPKLAKPATIVSPHVLFFTR